jgi:hypothetical protein
VAATEHPRAPRSGVHPERSEGSLRLSKPFAWLASLLGSLFAIGGARAADLPEDSAEALLHVYKGGGVTAWGPAFLVRKSVADRFSLTGSYYLDAVSNASIDVVTTASKYKETRHEFALSATTSTATRRSPSPAAPATSPTTSPTAPASTSRRRCSAA